MKFEYIESIDVRVIKNNRNYIDTPWIVWMYGQLFTGEHMVPIIETEYLKIKEEMTERNKMLSSTYHLTSMYDVIEMDAKYSRFNK